MINQVQNCSDLDNNVRFEISINFYFGHKTGNPVDDPCQKTDERTLFFIPE